MSTSSKRRAEKRRWAHLSIQEKAGEIAMKRPPRVVSGAPLAFEVSDSVEHDWSYGPDATKRYETRLIMNPPRERRISVPVFGLSRSADPRFGPSPSYHEFVAVRMAFDVSSPSSVTRLEWYTWKPARGDGYPAVHRARAILESARRRLAEAAYLPEYQLRAWMLEVAEMIQTVRAAADEWLGEPELVGKPRREANEYSRY